MSNPKRTGFHTRRNWRRCWRKNWSTNLIGQNPGRKAPRRLSAPESDRRMPCTSCLRSPKFSLQPTSKCTSYSLDARRMPNDGRAFPSLSIDCRRARTKRQVTKGALIWSSPRPAGSHGLLLRRNNHFSKPGTVVNKAVQKSNTDDSVRWFGYPVKMMRKNSREERYR